MQVAAKCIGFGILTINKMPCALPRSHTHVTSKEQQQKWRWRLCGDGGGGGGGELQRYFHTYVSSFRSLYFLYIVETICCVESRGTEADSLFPNCNKFASASTHTHTHSRMNWGPNGKYFISSQAEGEAMNTLKIKKYKKKRPLATTSTM